MHALLARLDARLVDGWRHAWRWWTVQLHIAATALLTLVVNVGALPPDMVKLVPQPWANLLLGVWGFLGLLARLWPQPKGVSRG